MPKQPKGPQRRGTKKIAYEKSLLQGNFNLNLITIDFIHKQTHACLCRATLSNAEVDLNLKNTMMVIHGVLGNFKLFDMTNYPKTLNSDIRYLEIRPSELLGLGTNEGSVLKMKIKNYDQDHSDVKDSITTIVDLQVSPVRLNYHQQPIMRIIDYAMIQVNKY